MYLLGWRLYIACMTIIRLNAVLMMMSDLDHAIM